MKCAHSHTSIIPHTQGEMRQTPRYSDKHLYMCVHRDQMNIL